MLLFQTKKNGSNFSWDIHFWLGSDTSQVSSGNSLGYVGHILLLQYAEHVPGMGEKRNVCIILVGKYREYHELQPTEGQRGR